MLIGLMGLRIDFCFTLLVVPKVHLPGIGPSTITDLLLEQGEKGIDRWREWLRTCYSALVKSGDEAGLQA